MFHWRVFAQPVHRIQPRRAGNFGIAAAGKMNGFVRQDGLKLRRSLDKKV
jgi:hypothetical protein